MEKQVTLREMLEAMARYKDEEPFRWFRTSCVGADGTPCAGPLLMVTMGQARQEVLGSK